MKDRNLCPCCGQYHRNFYEDLGICKVCGWEEDCVQEDDPDYTGGSNIISLISRAAMKRVIRGTT